MTLVYKLPKIATGSRVKTWRSAPSLWREAGTYSGCCAKMDKWLKRVNLPSIETSTASTSTRPTIKIHPIVFAFSSLPCIRWLAAVQMLLANLPAWPLTVMSLMQWQKEKVSAVLGGLNFNIFSPRGCCLVYSHLLMLYKYHLSGFGSLWIHFNISKWLFGIIWPSI